MSDPYGAARPDPERPWSASAAQPSWAAQAQPQPGALAQPEWAAQASPAGPYGAPEGLAPWQQPWGYYRPPTGDPGTLDLPWYGIGFVDAVKRGVTKTFRYDGRASLGEFWWFYLATVVGALVVYAVVFGLSFVTMWITGGPQAGTALVTIIGVVVLIAYWLGAAAASLSLTVRRLHDAGQSGWMYLISLVPFVGSIILLVFLLSGPKPEGQRFDRGYGYWEIEQRYGLSEAPYGYPR